jgi:hypothetical protein
MMIGKSARNQDKLSNILNHCLELIESNVETVDSILEKYPDYSDVLRPPLEAAQWLYSRSEFFNPRPGFVQLSRRRLINRFQNYSDAVGISTDTGTFLPPFFQKRRILIQYSALITLTAVLLFVGYRSSSFLVQRSIPGDPLYSLKLAQEDFRLSLSLSDVVEAQLRIEFAQKRVIEMQELVLVGRGSLLDETMDNFGYQMDKAAAIILTIAETDESVAAELSTLFATALTVPVNNLVGILNAAPGLASTSLLNTLHVVVSGINSQLSIDSWIVSITPIATEVYTATITPTIRYTPTFTASLSPSSTATPTFLPSDTPPSKVEPTFTPTVKPSKTPAPTDGSSSTPQPTSTPTVKPTSPPAPTDTPAPTDSPTSTQAPTNTPEPTPEETKKPKPTKPTEHPTYWPSFTPPNEN